MAIIIIKDLPESVDLDRTAMAAINGGARASVRQSHFRRGTISGDSKRIINYPAGFSRNPLADANEPLAGSRLLKKK